MTESSQTMRARLDFAYDGTEFAGWAVQPELRTVQGELESALARVTRVDPVRTIVAGRTDAGVHARAQVAHVDLPRDAWERMPGRVDRTPGEGLTSHLNGVLPPDIRVFATTEAPAGFDARFSALERRYVYRVSDSHITLDPLARRHVLGHSRPLDVDALNSASATLTGLRDFVPFCRAREGATTIRTLLEFTWLRRDDGVVEATVRADAFCHSMVRSLVGAVLEVGDGRRDVAWLVAEASRETRSPSVRVAPAHGLTLEAVEYPPDAQLAARATDTRGRRTLD